jgi:hypothetical protein
MRKIMEVIKAAERISSFIESNCEQGNLVIISWKDRSDLTNILDEEKERLYEKDESTNKSRAYNKALNKLYTEALCYINYNVRKPIYKKDAEEKLFKLIRIFVSRIARYAHMSSEELLIRTIMNK